MRGALVTTRAAPLKGAPARPQTAQPLAWKPRARLLSGQMARLGLEPSSPWHLVSEIPQLPWDICMNKMDPGDTCNPLRRPPKVHVLSSFGVSLFLQWDLSVVLHKGVLHKRPPGTDSGSPCRSP